MARTKAQATATTATRRYRGLSVRKTARVAASAKTKPPARNRVRGRGRGADRGATSSSSRRGMPSSLAARTVMTRARTGVARRPSSRAARVGPVTLTLLDWRRRVTTLYAAARAAGDPEAGWRIWRDGRDELFAGHPDSPLDAASRNRFRGLPYAPYDPALRFEADLEPASPQRLELPTDTDGVVPLDRIGAVTLGDVGRLDVWWLGGYGGGGFLPLRDGSAGRATYGGGRHPPRTPQGARPGGDRARAGGRPHLALPPPRPPAPPRAWPPAPGGGPPPA